MKFGPPILKRGCEAYVASQKVEGWVLIPDRCYHDGGLWDDTLEGPALKRLEMGSDNQLQLTVDRSVRHKIEIWVSSQQVSGSPPHRRAFVVLGVRMDCLFMWLLRHAEKAGAAGPSGCPAVRREQP